MVEIRHYTQDTTAKTRTLTNYNTPDGKIAIKRGKFKIKDLYQKGENFTSVFLTKIFLDNEIQREYSEYDIPKDVEQEIGDIIERASSQRMSVEEVIEHLDNWAIESKKILNLEGKFIDYEEDDE